MEIIEKREVHYKESLGHDKLNKEVQVVSGKMAIKDIKKLSPVFERLGSIRLAYLFGSVAKGEVPPLCGF